MKKQYGVLLIGCGHIGREHLEDIYWRENIRIVGAADTDRSRAEEFCRRFGGRPGEDYRKFLSLPELDIVIIAANADSHLSVLQDCLQAGKHVLCEKPIGISMTEAEKFAELARSSGSRVQVAHILRHNRTYQEAAKLLHGGAVGELRLMRMVQNHHALDWARYRRLLQDCPPIVDCGVHYLDVMRWFSGSEFAQVDGWGGRLGDDLPPGAYNYGVIQVRMENGVLGTYEAGWSQNLSSENRKDFIGTKGRLSITLQQDRKEHREEGDLIEIYRSDTGEYRTLNVHAKYKDMWAQFCALVHSIETDEPTVPTLEDVLVAFRCAVRADAALRGKEI